ncbi:uncharacterized protein JN550_001326 [Neoarthrinium moseri]|uniref:uncharacterized protein n=1 Tax=Neoarthrinium moseri TaxID=1658444 RepID=UPI001FDB6374|nr:uncharacterized protein JN550_001326 [Neoarthrinium moseri]KAI1877254.1 hypothetical protein JN550_001326 [Neoarthrinium moseri]
MRIRFLSLAIAPSTICAYSSFTTAPTFLDSSLLCASTLFQPLYCGRSNRDGLITNLQLEEEHCLTAPIVRAPSNTTWEVRPSIGKGLGVFATALIKTGTRIMVEEPLFSINPPEFVPGKGYEIQAMIDDVDVAVAGLTAEQRSDFHSCHEYRLPSEQESDEHRNMFIFRSNAYTLTDGTVAMFPKIAKINHSCRPNAANVWSEASGLRIIWAARDIQAGEEVTVTYAPLLKSHAGRQSRLSQYGFQCTCAACVDHERTDSERVKMGKYLSELEDRLTRNTSEFANKKLLPKALALVEMLELEHMMDYLPNAYYVAAEISLRLKDSLAASKWSTKALTLHGYADERSHAVLQERLFLDRISH